MPRSCGALEQPPGKVEKNVAQVSVFCISTYMTVNKCQVFYDGISKQATNVNIIRYNRPSFSTFAGRPFWSTQASQALFVHIDRFATYVKQLFMQAQFLTFLTQKGQVYERFLQAQFLTFLSLKGQVYERFFASLVSNFSFFEGTSS